MTTITHARRARRACRALTTVTAAAASCLIIGMSCSSASATQVSEPVPHDAHPATSSISSSVSASLSKTSAGFHLYNRSSYSLVLQSADGDNAGVPGDGSTLVTGLGYHDFEVVYRAGNDTTVHAVYQIQNEQGQRVGTAYFNMTYKWLGNRTISTDFRDMNNNKISILKTNEIDGGDNYEILNTSTVTTTLDANDPKAAELVQQFCKDIDNTSLCTFTPKNRTTSTVSKLLNSAYMDADSEEEGDIDVEGGYTQTTSTSTELALSASLKIAHIITVGVKTTYGEDMETSHSYSNAYATAVKPGRTSYIWGQVPVIGYTGTLTATIGNATWNITNYDVTTPDPARDLAGLSGNTFEGYYPIGRPDTPPTS